MKKIMILVMACVMLVGFTACSAPATEAPVEAAPAEIADEPAAETTEAAALEEPSEDAGAPSGDDAKRIFFVNPIKALDFFVYIEASVKKTAEEYGYTVDSVDANNDYAAASDYISQAIVNGYDMIMLCGDKSLIPAADEAYAAGVPVINFDAYIGADNLAARVASDNYGMGVQAGEYALELLKEANGGEATGKIISINFPQIETMKDRCAGFASVFEGIEGVEIQEEIPKDQFIDECQKHMDNVLTANPQGTVDLIYGSNSGAALGALAAVEAGNRSEIIVMGIDDEEGQLNALKDPDSPYYASVAQDPVEIGKLCVEAASKVFNGEEVGVVGVGSNLVTKENVEEFIANEDGKKKALESYK